MTKKDETVTAGQPLTAQEIAQMINQSQDALMSKLSTMMASLASTGVSVTEERMYDIGEGEAWKANLKRSYDEYQHESLESIRRSRLFYDQIVQNGITSAKLADLQAIRHAEIAIDRQWNIDEQGYTSRAVLSDEYYKDALKEILAEVKSGTAKK